MSEKHLSDDTLSNLVARGHKVECPVCGGRFMSEGYRPFHGSGIGQHMRFKHDMADAVVEAGKRMERSAKLAKQAADREARERPLRAHIVTGAFLDEVSAELRSLIGMMEAYYSQGNCADDAYDLIERIENMHVSHPKTPANGGEA